MGGCGKIKGMTPEKFRRVYEANLLFSVVMVSGLIVTLLFTAIWLMVMTNG